jgi:hypothetical protein
MRHQGKTLKMVSLKKIFPNDHDQHAPAAAKQPRLLLIFSELGCNVCQDEETKFAVSIASEYGPEYVMAVVHASNRRYVQNYIRMNRVNFPVFFCEDDAFLEENEIKNTPMIFIVDEENRVIASHFLLPDVSSSEIFRADASFLLSLFEPYRQVIAWKKGVIEMSFPNLHESTHLPRFSWFLFSLEGSN